MLEYLARRLIYMVPTLIGVTFLVFVSVRLIPGDPALVIAGQQASAELVERIREELGLNRPLLVQYAIYLGDLLRGDLGTSLFTRMPVADEIGRRLPYTLELAGLSLLLASLVGVTVGVISATRPNSLLDNAGMVMALLGVSVPVFWLGLMLMSLFAVQLPRWLGLAGPVLPPTGAGTWQHLVMPSLTLAAFSTAIIARMTRSAMLDVIREDYVRTARAKGLAERAVIYRHALRNALVPVVTIQGLQFGTLMGGAVLTETVFSWPGLGRFVVDAIFRRDYPALQAATLVVAVGFMLINLLVDVIYAVLDPRIRYG